MIKNPNNKGFISLIFILVGALIFLKYSLKFDIFEVLESLIGKENIARFVDFISLCLKTVYSKIIELKK